MFKRDTFLFPFSIDAIYVLSKSHSRAKDSWLNPSFVLSFFICFPNFSFISIFITKYRISSMWLKNNGLYVTKGRNVKIWGDLEGKEKYECIRSIRKSHNPKVVSSSLTPATNSYITRTIMVLVIFCCLKISCNNV